MARAAPIAHSDTARPGLLKSSETVLKTLAIGASLLAACRVGYDASPRADPDSGPFDPDAAQVDAAPLDAAAPDAAPAMATTVASGSITPGAASEDLAIAPVFLSESFVVCSRRSSSSAPNANTGRCQLTDGSTLHIESDALDNTAAVSWSVVQVPGAIVQRGSTGFGSTDSVLNVALSAVDPTRSFVLLSSSSSLVGVDNDERTIFMGELSANNSLRLSRGDSAIGATVDWQVIELPSTSVQSGVDVLGIGVSNLVVPISNVDPSRTFVTYTTELDKDIDGAEASYKSRSLLSANDITFTRQAGSAALTVSWFAVELPVGSTVLSFEGQTTDPHDQTAIDISSAGITASMFPLTHVEINSGSLRTVLNAASLASTVSTGTLHLERSVAASGSQLSYRSTLVDIVMP